MSRVELPSRMVGEMRPLKGPEIVALANLAEDKDAKDEAGGFAHIINPCWAQTVDPGPYKFVLDAKPPWQRLCKGDLLAALIKLRQISCSDGDEFDFDVRCAEDRCRKRIEWSVNLRTELKWLEIKDEVFELLAAGQPLETRAKGSVIHYHLQTVEQEGPVVRFLRANKRKRATGYDIAAGQIRAIDGKPVGIKEAYQWVSDLTIGELGDLREAMDANEVGVDTAIEVRCEACGWEQPTNLPLAAISFFTARRRKKRAEPPTQRIPIEDQGLVLPSGSESSGLGTRANGGGTSALISSGDSTAVVGSR